MSKSIILAVLAIPAALLAPLLMLGGQNAAAVALNNPELTCEVTATPVHSGITLRGVVKSDQTLSGDYEFLLLKRGAGGSSTSAQSGSFAVEAGQEEVIAEVTIGPDRDARYSADLSVRWDGGGTSCTASN